MLNFGPLFQQFCGKCGTGGIDWRGVEGTIMTPKALKRVVCYPPKQTEGCANVWEPTVPNTKIHEFHDFHGPHVMNRNKALIKASAKKDTDKKFMYMQQFFQIYWDSGLTVPIQYSPLLCVMAIDFEQAKYLPVLFCKWKISVHIAIDHNSLKCSVWWIIP